MEWRLFNGVSHLATWCYTPERTMQAAPPRLLGPGSQTTWHALLICDLGSNTTSDPMQPNAQKEKGSDMTDTGQMTRQRRRRVQLAIFFRQQKGHAPDAVT
jgi:hypothetical protein